MLLIHFACWAASFLTAFLALTRLTAWRMSLAASPSQLGRSSVSHWPILPTWTLVRSSAATFCQSASVIPIWPSLTLPGVFLLRAMSYIRWIAMLLTHRSMNACV